MSLFPPKHRKERRSSIQVNEKLDLEPPSPMENCGKKVKMRAGRALAFTEEVMYDTEDPACRESTVCKLCDVEFEECDEVRRLFFCSHLFHSECLESDVIKAVKKHRKP